MPKTTVKGNVDHPAGKLPLYNVMVYVPNAPLAPLVEALSCDKCGADRLGPSLVASALTVRVRKLHHAGRPRRGATSPSSSRPGSGAGRSPCPRSRPARTTCSRGPTPSACRSSQSEGHLPKIAMTRGQAPTAWNASWRRIGVSDSEFTNPDGAGRVNIYYETGGGTGYDSGDACPARLARCSTRPSSRTSTT